MKKTPLYETHIAQNGKLIDFGSWELPVEYTGIISEHEAVRNAAGLFDVSHMGEILITGKDAEKYLQKMVTNDISNMAENQIFYSLMCYPQGGVVDDILIYKYSIKKYLLVVNASNSDKDVEWLQSHVTGQVKVEDLSSSYALLALQGPNAQEILQKLTDTNLNELKFFYFNDHILLGNIPAFVSRNGYTGEDGFEILVAPEYAEALWKNIFNEGKDHGLLPAGLGARDTLRFEVCLPLYGHEIDENITPYEAGLGYFVKLDKGEFLGREVLAHQKSEGPKRKLVGLEMIDRGIPRAGYDVFSGDRKIGHITTGSYSPTLRKNLGLALLDSEHITEGSTVEVMIRNKPLKALIVKKPFYSKKYKK